MQKYWLGCHFLEAETVDKSRVETNEQPDLSSFSEIQGIVASGYRKFPAMSCLLLHVEEREKAIQSLKQIQSQVSFSDDQSKASSSRLNLAFSWQGLNRLNSSVANEEAELFKREFRQGMVAPHRQRILGDLDGSPSAPRHWFWGQPQTQPVHLALLVYELDDARRAARVEDLLARLALKLVDYGRIDSVTLKNQREHFGFVDGLSQPWMRDLNVEGAASDEVAWGEFLLGYRDNLGAVQRHPKIAFNGSYLVVRQIEQDVQGFWQSLEASKDQRVLMAAKQMGRWPDGTPITVNPNSADNQPTNNFDYANDQEGFRCPAGAHIRRCNPRKGGIDGGARKHRHRILRRGRPYGAPAPIEFYPPEIQPDVSSGVGSKDQSRGLMFMCLNSNFERQFEFVQSNWINSTMIASLSDERDPIASQMDFEAFTIPTDPIRKRCPRPQAYTKTVGGEYFFLPSRSAITQILT